MKENLTQLIQSLESETNYKREQDILNKLKEIKKEPLRSRTMQKAIKACRYVSTKLEAIQEMDMEQKGAMEYFTDALKTEKNNAIAIEMFYRINDANKSKQRSDSLHVISSTACCSFIMNYVQKELNGNPIIRIKKRDLNLSTYSK